MQAAGHCSWHHLRILLRSGVRRLRCNRLTLTLLAIAMLAIRGASGHYAACKYSFMTAHPGQRRCWVPNISPVRYYACNQPINQGTKINFVHGMPSANCMFWSHNGLYCVYAWIRRWRHIMCTMPIPKYPVKLVIHQLAACNFPAPGCKGRAGRLYMLLLPVFHPREQIKL